MKESNNMKVFFTYILLSISTFILLGQENSFRIVFYNVENYFDPLNDSLTKDDEFTKDGTRHWSWYKFNQKTTKIYKAISAFSQWTIPDVIAFCEIENRFVLEELIKKTPFIEQDYQIIHEESEDFRGIDVGLIYNPKTVWPLEHHMLKIRFEGKPNKRTRDILHFKALLKNKDTLHVFVNHWPSKYGGAIATIPLRAQAASTLKIYTDSILAVNPKAHIVITGDFNDTPEDESITKHLGAAEPGQQTNGQLINLSTNISKLGYKGTHRYQGQWSTIDQFIVSPAMLNKESKVYTNEEMLKVGNIDILMEEDKKYTGKKPYRTFIGFKYHGGFSDHLPILLDLKLQ
jgi:predicted extracellular nuclease